MSAVRPKSAFRTDPPLPHRCGSGRGGIGRWIILAGLVVTTAARAHGLSLWRFYTEARRYDARYAQSQATLRAARTISTRARAAFLPKISANANTSYNDMSANFFNFSDAGLIFPNGHFDFNANGYGITVTEALFDMRAIDAYRAAGPTVRAARLRDRLARSALMLRATNAYFALLLAKSELRLAQAQDRSLRTEWLRARQSFQLGTATITDANEARARYDMVMTEVLAAANAVRIARSRMQRMTGRPVAHLWRIDLRQLPKPPRRAQLATDMRMALDHNLSLRMARAELRAARALAAAAGAERWPRIEAEAAYSYTRADNSSFGFGSTIRQKSVGIELSIPIYQGGELRASAAKARAEARRAFFALVQARRMVRFDVRQSFLDVRNGYAEIVALTATEKASRSALSSDQLGLKIGIRNNVDVLAAQQRLFAARRDLVRAVFTYLVGRLGLRAALGPLTGHDLQALNVLLHPPRGSIPASPSSASR